MCFLIATLTGVSRARGGGGGGFGTFTKTNTTPGDEYWPDTSPLGMARIKKKGFFGDAREGLVDEGISLWRI